MFGWKDVNYSRNFNNLSHDEQQDIIGKALDTKYITGYYYTRVVNNIFNFIDDNLKVVLVENMIKSSDKYTTCGTIGLKLIQSAKDIDENRIKTAVSGSHTKGVRSLLLTFDGLNLEEEICGLRAISGSKYVPFDVFNIKYMPTFEALSKLPSIMRLKALESLTCYTNKIMYNIFANINEHQMNKLILAAGLKYPDRVKKIKDFYTDLEGLGIKATVSINGECGRCGEFSVSFTSYVSKTKAGFSRTQLGRMFDRGNCPVCGDYNLITESTFSFEGQS